MIRQVMFHVEVDILYFSIYNIYIFRFDKVTYLSLLFKFILSKKLINNP